MRPAIIILACLMIAGSAFGDTVYEKTWAEGTVVFAWTVGVDSTGSAPDAAYHEVRLIWTDPAEQTATESMRINMPESQAVVARPRSGHFVFQVRACPNDLEAYICSEWVSSNGPYGTVNGQPEPWAVFWKPQAPWGVIVEDF